MDKWNQVIDANWRVPYIGGWCEGYQEMGFSQASMHQRSDGSYYTTGVWPSAMAAWNANYGNGNHPGELPPVGRTVPVFFSLGSTPDGHTAISLDDGMVASSTQPGYHLQGFLHPTLQNLIDVYAKYNNGCTYLGWSEFSGKARVVAPVQTNPLATEAEVRQAYLDILHREADPDGLTHYMQYTIDFVRNDLMNSQERKNLEASIAAQQAADVAAKQVADAAKAAQDATDAAKTAADVKAAQDATDAANATAETAKPVVSPVEVSVVPTTPVVIPPVVVPPIAVVPTPISVVVPEIPAAAPIIIPTTSEQPVVNPVALPITTPDTTLVQTSNIFVLIWNAIKRIFKIK